MANSDVALPNDVFSIFGNPAGLSQINWREVGIYYSPAPFGLTELSNGYIAYTEPLSFGSLSIGGMTYGFDLYRESKLVLGYSYNYENILFAGISVNYHNYSIQNYGSTGTFYLNAGGLVYILDELRWGHEAVMQMELLDKPFYVFSNAGNGHICVIHRRKDGNVGLIEPVR